MRKIWSEQALSLIHISGFDSLDEKTSEIFERILFLYQGDLLPGYDTEAWVVHKSMYYHTLFLKAAYRYISLLSDENRYQDIIRVSRKALEVDEFDSKLNLEYMTALLALEMKTEALNHYNYTVDLCYTQLGTKPSDDIPVSYTHLSVMSSFFWFFTQSTTPAGPFSSRICFVPDSASTESCLILGNTGTSN